MELASKWSPLKLTLERIHEKRSLRAANRGTSSVNGAPGTLLSIVEKGPRNSTGALGLGSNKSRWLGPPPSHTSKIDLAAGVCVAARVIGWPSAKATGAAVAARTN